MVSTVTTAVTAVALGLGAILGGVAVLALILFLVQREFYDYLRCGILAHGFLRLGCDTCKHEILVPFSCKRQEQRARAQPCVS